MEKPTHLILCRTSREEMERGVPVIVKGKGVRVFDQDGKSYLDLVSGVTRPVHVGYGREELARAVYDQMVELGYFTPMQFTTLPAIRLADLMAE